MQDARRRQYLTAMGIDQWQLKVAAPAPTPLPSRPADAASEAKPELDEPIVEIVTAADPKPTSQPEYPKPAIDVSTLTWPALAEQVAACQACGLRDQSQAPLLGQGNQQASLMVIAGPPNASALAQADVFSGEQLQLMTAMLAAIEQPLTQVFRVGVLRCASVDPSDSAVDPAALKACRAYLERQIALIQPKALLVFGELAGQAVLDSELPLAQLRGQAQQHAASETPVWVTHAPAHLLSNPGDKREAWEDLQQLWRKLREAEA